MDSRKNKRTKRSSSGAYIKVIVLGDSGVGKTCLINRYTDGYYEDTFASTLSVDFKIGKFEWNSIKVNLQIWDTVGQERFKTITKSYFQGCLGVLLVFSLTNLDSFRNIEKWLDQLDEYNDQKLTKILVGAKLDNPADERVVSIEQCAQMAQKKDLEYFQVSSKTGYNVVNVFETLGDRIMTKMKEENNKNNKYSQFFEQNKNIRLDYDNETPQKRCEC